MKKQVKVFVPKILTLDDGDLKIIMQYDDGKVSVEELLSWFKAYHEIDLTPQMLLIIKEQVG